MASEFYSGSIADERKEWRQHPMTKLAIKMLREFKEGAARDVLEGSPSRPPTETSDDIGFHRGINECIELLEKD